MRLGIRQARAAIVAGAVLVALAMPASARGAIEIFDFGVFPETGPRLISNSEADSQSPFDNSDRPELLTAGAHPYLNITMSFCPKVYFESANLDKIVCGPSQYDDQLRNIVLGLPPGLLANLQALPTCSTADYLADSCPSDTRIGKTGALAFANDVYVPNPTVAAVSGDLYNLETVGLEPGRLGAVIRPNPANPVLDSVWQVTLVALRTTGDYGADSTIPEIPRVGTKSSVDTPDDLIPVKVVRVNVSLFSEVNGRPFIVNPTSCAPAVSTIKVNTYQDPLFVSGPPSTFTPTGCENVPFTPGVEIQPTDTDRAGVPSGQEIAVTFPDSVDDEIVQSHVRNAEVTLPEGMTLNPAAAIGLEGCTAEQLGLGSDDPVRCPAASEVGDVRVETPLLPGAMTGKVYFAKPTSTAPPTEQSPWKVYLAIEGFGIRIKLQGDVTVDQKTGRIKNVFRDLPPAPFTRFELRMKGGDTAPLANPAGCGTHTLEATFEGWSGATASPTASLTTTGDGQGGPCADPRPFSPAIQGSASTTQAGAETALGLDITRPSGQQLLRDIDVTLPPGLVGSLTQVPLCPLAQAVAGACPEDSKIGSVTTSVGDGARQLSLDGSLYLAEPQVPGDPASVSIVVPAKVGPIDLGQVVVTGRVVVDRRTARVTTTSSNIPTIYAGIPQRVRRIEVNIDRQGFLRNPTSCASNPLVASFRSDQGTPAAAAFGYQATGCEALAFTPRLRMIAGGSRALTRKTDPTKNDVHPRLTAIVSQPAGQANIAASRVVLPWILRPNVPRIQMPGALCQDDQVARRACPPLSRVGTAVAYSPLLPTPLRGPVYIVQQFEEANPLPRLAVFLDGIASVQLAAQNRFVGGTNPRERIRTVNTFDGIPDVPVTYFRLEVDGGELGLLNNWRDLCRVPDTFDGSFTSHSGRSFSFKTPLEVEGCEEPVSVFRILTRSATMTRSGVVRVRVKCTAAKRCAGRLTLRTASRVRVSKRRKARRRKLTLARKRFSLRPGQTRTLRVRLSRKARRAVRRARRLRVRISTRVAGQRVRKTVTVKAPKRKRARRGRRRR